MTKVNKNEFDKIFNSYYIETEFLNDIEKCSKENKLDCDFTCRDTNCDLDTCKDCELFQKCDTCTNQLTCEVN